MICGRERRRGCGARGGGEDVEEERTEEMENNLRVEEDKELS